MELQPAISNRTSSRPLAGADASMPAGGDPEIAIPGGVLQPDPPEQASLDDSANADIEPLPAEPDYVAETRPAASVRKWSLAFVASLVFHLAVAAMLIFAPESILPPRELTPTEIAGANGTKPLLFGNEENDATAAALFGVVPAVLPFAVDQQSHDGFPCFNSLPFRAGAPAPKRRLAEHTVKCWRNTGKNADCDAQHLMLADNSMFDFFATIRFDRRRKSAHA